MGYSIKRLRKPCSVKGDHDGAGAEWDLAGLLHSVDPYVGFDFNQYPRDLSGWGSDSQAFDELISLLPSPTLIVEVGTWKGASAIEMAKALDRHHQAKKAQILCIDTWLGALEFWTNHDDAERYGSLKLNHGYPTVYYQFLANVCHAGFQDVVIPFPQTSTIAAQFLRTHAIQADLIYIDGSHEEEDVYQDLQDYWPILKPSGTVFGDDYSWDGVRLAVERFAKEAKKTVKFSHDKWLIQNK